VSFPAAVAEQVGPIESVARVAQSQDAGTGASPRGGSLSHRVCVLARRAVGVFPLTPTGLVLLAFAAVAFWLLGVRRLDLVVLAIASLGAGLAGLAVLLVSLVTAFTWLRLRRAGRPGLLLLECDVRQPTGFVAPLPRWLPLVEVSWRWLDPPEAEVTIEPGRNGLVERVLPHRRAYLGAVTRRVSVRDVMGLAAISWDRSEPREVHIAPARGLLDRMPLLEGLTGGEDLSEPRGSPHGDRVDMRQYTRGDSPRLILWKVYARTRKLLVRIPERAVTARPRACAYLVAGDGDEASASLARAIVERGSLGDNWRFGADGSLTPATDTASALEIIIASGSAPEGVPTAFPGFLARAARDGFSICFACLPARRGPWADGVVAALRQTSMRVHLLTAVDGSRAALQPERAWHRFVLRRRPGGPPGVDDLAHMAQSFHGFSCPFTAVDRAGGRVLGDPRRFAPPRAARGRRP
jgi:hypothetical protein